MSTALDSLRGLIIEAEDLGIIRFDYDKKRYYFVENPEDEINVHSLVKQIGIKNENSISI